MMPNVIVSTTGTQDGTTRFVGTSHIPINDAIYYVGSNGGGKVFIEKGTYTISGTISIEYPNVELCGEGDFTVLNVNASVAIIALQITPSLAIDKNIYIHDLNFTVTLNCSNLINIVNQGNGTYPTSYTSAKIGSTDDSTKIFRYSVLIENCILNGSAYAINLSASKNVIIKNNVIKNAVSYAVYLTSSVNNIIENNYIINCNGYGIYEYTSSYRNRITSNFFNNLGNYSIRLNGTYHSVYNYNMLLNGASYTLYSASATFNTISNNLIGNSAATYALYLTSSSNSTLRNNMLCANSKYGIYVVSSGYVSTIGNVSAYNATSNINILSTSSYCYNISNVTTAGLSYSSSTGWNILNVTA
jgi:parallel beta-helix repeat protein